MPDHPSEADLRAYGLGRLDDAPAAEIAAHLDACPACRRRAAEASSDSFLGRLRDARAAAGGGAEPSPQAVAARSATGGRDAEPPPADSLPPGLADHPDYTILRELGRGGMGVVYLAHNTIMGRDEVLKVMGAHIMERPGIFDRFQREIRAVARLHHKNIVTAYSAFRLGGGLVFAMEYVEGMDLARLIKVKGPLPVVHAAYFAQQAARGLQHAHERGMVHRDIKPHNLMLTHDGDLRVVKILDFGLAKATREGHVDAALTQSGQALGTPDYIAPEQILNAPDVDVRADVYSLGCTLYFFLTGRAPFRGNSLYDLYQAHMSREADPLNRIRPDVPSGLAALASKMIAKDPADRFQTPAEVADALAPFLKKAAADPRPATAPPRPAATDPAVELTRDDRPIPTPPPIPKPTAASPDKPAPPEAMWTSLIDFRDTEAAGRSATPPPVVLPARTAARGKLPPRAVAIGLGALGTLLALALLAAQLFVRTPDGTIVFDDLPKDAVVTVDGAKVDVAWAEGDAGRVSVAAGPHGLEVRQGRVKLYGDRVTVDAGKPFSIRLERPGVVPEGSAPRGDVASRATSAEGAAPAPTSAAVVPADDANPWPAAETPDGEIREGWFAAAVSPDLRRAIWDGPNGVFHIVSAAGDRAPIDVDASKHWVWHMDFSPDGEHVASSGNDDLVKIWDASTGALVRELRGHTAGVLSFAYSRDGRRLASAGMDATVRIWDVESGALQATLNGHTDNVWCVAFSPDGRRLASGEGNYEDRTKGPGQGKVLLWDLEAGSSVALDEHDMRAAAVAFSPDGRRLATASFDKTVKVWDVEARRCIATLRGTDACRTAVAFSPDGRLIAEVGRDGVARVWDASDFSLVVAREGLANFVRFSPGGGWIYTGGPANLKAWRIPRPAASAPTASPPAPPAPADGFTPLFNRWDLGGWEQDPNQPGDWRVENGVLVGTTPKRGYLNTIRRDYKDFRLRVEARINDGGDAGVFVRSDPPNLTAYEAQINSTNRDPSRTGSLFRPPAGIAVAAVREPLVGPDEWFTMDVAVEGAHVVVKVNGRVTADYIDPDPLPAGAIALQVHDARSRVEFRRIEIKELDAAPPVVAPAPAVAAADGFTPLFNGRDTTGWKTHAGQPGDWRVEGGVLIGTAPGASHLYTTRGDYEDFELRVEARINGGGNSGVLFRASDDPRPKWPQGYEAQVYAGEGPQTGSLYRVAGAPVGTLSRPVDAPTRLTKPDDWFTMNVVVRGDHVVVKVNGQSAADYVDPRPFASAGYIVLQVHDARTRVEFRKIEIKELAAAPRPAPAPREGFSRIFNGTDLSGWTVDSGPKDGWTVEGGALTAKGPGDYRKAGFLLSDRDYGDFRLRFEYQASPGANSGVTFRARPGEFEGAVAHPLQIELFDRDHPDLKNGTFFWSTSFRAADTEPPARPAEMKPTGEWNAVELTVRGDVMAFAVNGREVQRARLDALAGRPGANPALGRRRGRIGFQCHTGTVRFRNVEIIGL